MDTTIFSITDELAELIKQYVSGKLSESQTRATLEKITPRIKEIESTAKDEHHLAAELRRHSSENFSIFTAVVALSPVLRFLSYCGEDVYAEPVLSALANVTHAETVQKLDNVKGLATPLYCKIMSINGSCIAFTALSSSSFFSTDVMEQAASKLIPEITALTLGITDYYAELMMLQAELCRSLNDGMLYAEIFHFFDVAKIFSHSGVYNLIAISKEIEHYIANQDPSAFVAVLNPHLYVVLRRDKQNLLENPQFSHRGIPFRPEHRVVEINSIFDFSSVLSMIRSF